MNISRELLEVRVEAPFACFTRPESKAERVSYPIMTPSAARGVLEAIYWKPEFSWRVESISLLPYPQPKGQDRPSAASPHFSIVRNEVTRRAVVGSEGFVAAEERN